MDYSAPTKKARNNRAMAILPQLPWYYFIPLYCIFISLLLFATRDLAAAKASPISPSNIHRVICIPASVIFSSLYFLTYRRTRTPNLVLWLHCAYILIGFLSTYLFSEWLFYSVWKLLEMVAVVMTGLYVWTLELNHPGILIVFYNKTIAFFKFILLSVLASLLVMPGSSIQAASNVNDAFLPYRISGQLLKINPISVGTISAFIIYIISVKYLSNKKDMRSWDYIWFSSSIILLIFSQSRTAIAGLVLALVLFITFTKKTNLLGKAGIFIVGLFACYIFSVEILGYLQRGQSTHGLYSLTGRLTWWSFAYNKLVRSDFLHQLFGYGFAIGDRIMAQLSSGNRMQTLDSTYMSSLVSSGLIGTFILCSLVIYTNVQLFKKITYNNLYGELFGLNVILTIKSITTTTFNIFTMYTLLFLILTLFSNKKNIKYKT